MLSQPNSVRAQKQLLIIQTMIIVRKLAQLADFFLLASAMLHATSDGQVIQRQNIIEFSFDLAAIGKHYCSFRSQLTHISGKADTTATTTNMIHM